MYLTPLASMFENSEDCDFGGGNFVVEGEGSMMERARKCTFAGGNYRTSGDGGMGTCPSVRDLPSLLILELRLAAKMLHNQRENTFRDGATFTVNGQRVGPPSHVLDRGTSTATGGISPIPANYGTGQPSVYPNGQQGK